MYCRVCGDKRNVQYRLGKRQSLCDSCNADTPVKVSRESFDKAYWKNDPTVSQSTKREFYEDYLASECTLPEYIKQTTFVVN